MKYFISLTLASTMLAGVSAKAADIDPVPDTAPAVTHDWSGPYFGIQGGDIFDGEAVGINNSGPIPTSDFSGGLGGILSGYNFQNGNFVFGIDSDFSFTSIDEPIGSGSVELNTLSTVRGRVGYAFDRVLPYVTGGLAYSSVDIFGGPGFGTEDEFYFGWTAGAGVEVAATKNVSFRVQYNYVDLGSEEISFLDGSPINTVNVEIDDLHLIRAGVSIKTGFIFDKIFGR